MWYVQGGMTAVRTVGLGTRNSEFLSVVWSTVDGLQEACGALWMSIPTQTGFSRYSASASHDVTTRKCICDMVRLIIDILMCCPISTQGDSCLSQTMH